MTLADSAIMLLHCGSRLMKRRTIGFVHVVAPRLRGMRVYCACRNKLANMIFTLP